MVERQVTQHTRARQRHIVDAPIFGLTLGALIAFAGTAVAGTAPALPSGGQVQAGSATIAKTSASTLTIDQTSQKAVIDWASFRIGKSGTVQFDNGSGATLNEVSGASQAQIDGLLSATGSVYVIDPAGVIIGRSGVVHVGGAFVASTLDPGASSFLAGGPLTFAGASKAAVVNLGKIGSLGGDVALIGVTVANRGQISAARGDVGLAAGSEVVVQDRLLNGGKFSVVLGGAGTSATNTGSIQAAEAELRANGGNVYALAGNAGGTIAATGVASNDGKVFLIAEGGTTVARGEIDATSADGSGGKVETSGHTVNFDGLKVRAGQWLVDPDDLTISGADATTLSGALDAGTSVTLQTTATTPSETGVSGLGATSSGAGDIIVASAVHWGSSATLTLDAYHSIDINAPITLNGAGGVTLITNDGGSGGALNFAYGPSGFTGNIAFTDVDGGGVTQGALSINGVSYTLENNLAALAGDIAADPGGHYALANSYDASGDGTYGQAVIPTTFTGTLEGLGNSISNLTISANTAPKDEGIGLFANVSGPISDLAITGGSLTGNAQVGALAGIDGGSVTNVHSSMAVTGFDVVGGLIGDSSGAVANSSSSGAITGQLVDLSSSGSPGAVGGLIGEVDSGSVTASYATGAVTASGGEQVGGLIGYAISNNNVVVSNSYATGAVNAAGFPSAEVGGLIGDNGGAVINSYATGAVTGTQNVGGLIGYNENDAPGTDALNPTGDGTVVNSYATGSVTGYFVNPGDGIDVGGLIGYNNGAVAGAFAYGAVTGGDQLGGLIGTNVGSLRNVYSTGLVRAAAGASPSEMGGLVAEDDSGDVANAYWDTETSGLTTDGSFNSTGVTTAQLQTVGGVSLGAAFAGGAAGGQTGVFPYLTVLFPNGVQAVGGVAYSDGGTTAAVGAEVSAVADGTPFGSAMSGANGYYYIFAPAGSATGGQGLLAYAPSITAATATTVPATGGQGSVNLYGDAIAATTSDTLSSAAIPDVQSAVLAAANGNADALATVNAATGLDIIATGASFTIDQPLTRGDSFGVTTTAAGAPITVAAAVTLTGSAGLMLDAAGALAIDAPIVISGTGAVSLTAGSDYNFGLTASGFQGSLSFTGAEGGGQSLTIDGDSYTLVYSMKELANELNGSSANFALARSLTAGSYGGAVVGSFGGNFSGLGHTIGKLTITGSGVDVGLFGDMTGGVIRDIGVVRGAVLGGSEVGDLVGEQDAGLITDAYATGAVTATNDSAGGLVGFEGISATITHAHATGEVAGNLSVGGLVGQAQGSITDAFATGAVSGTIGAGGLVGNFSDGAITDAYATGAASGSQSVGGLVGDQVGGSITDAFAMGAVTGTSHGVGGLVGTDQSGSITDAYATGAVSGAVSAQTGGLLGTLLSGATITDGYYDAWTTGQALGAQADGSVGMTTIALQGALPTFQNSSLWSTGTGLYPYLTKLFPTGLQAVSGFAYSDVGTTPLASNANGAVTVGADVNGVTVGSATTGANGYYYILTGRRVLKNANVIAYTANAATLATATGALNTGGVDLYGQAVTTTTSESSYSQALADVVAAAMGNAAAVAAINAATGADITTNSPDFIIDQSVNTAGVFVIQATAPDSLIQVASPITINGSGVLTLDATEGAVTFDSAVTITGKGAVTLTAPGGYDFGVHASGFSGSMSFTGAEGAGQSLTIDGSRYTLIYSLGELASELNNASGNFALATSAAGGSYTSAVVGAFNGQFTGLGNSITGLTISGSSTNAGLFGILGANGVVGDIALVGDSVSGGNNVGALVGRSDGEVFDVYTTSSSVTGLANVGGLVGYQSGLGVLADGVNNGTTVSGTTSVGGLVGKSAGVIAFSYTTTAVSGNSDVGGIVGYNAGGLVTDSIASAGSATGVGGAETAIGGLAGLNTGTISGSTTSDSATGIAKVGGLVGYNAGGSLTDDASGDGDVSGTSLVGGLAGFNTGTIYDASSFDTVSGAKDVGGLVGENAGIINFTSAIGDVTGTGGAPVNVGGLVGLNAASGEILASQATDGSVSAAGGTDLGGLVGENAGDLEQSFATESVDSTGTGARLGGLVGYNASGATIADTYATGQVGAGKFVGGLVGYNAGKVGTSWTSSAVASGATSGGVAGANTSSGVFTFVYWDVATTGQANALGVGHLGSSTGVTAIGGGTGKDPHAQATYQGFDFTNVWTINPGTSRPYLQNNPPPTPPN